MANEEHLKILKQGVATWNLWREENPEIQPNLNEAKLNGARLCNADLFKAQLIGVDLSEAELIEADLYGANLSWANLDGANFTGANLISAELVGADLFETNLSKATLMFTDLSYARLVETNFEGTNFSDCFIYGISTWGLKLQGAKQSAFIITRNDESEITVDNLEIAQFIYMLLNNERIRDIVDTITLKVVLILGRFTPERKFVLDALREELRRRDYVPVLFDFEKPVNRDLTETVSTLAHMSRFIIADITDAKSIPQELGRIIPNLPSVPVQPLLLASEYEYGMFEHFKRFPWVLETYLYDNIEYLLSSLVERIITPSEAKARELQV